MRIEQRQYQCEHCGVFTADIDWEKPDEMFDQPCPKCRQMAPLHRPKPTGITPGHAPAVHGDVPPMGYVSRQFGRLIRTKADLRQAFKDAGAEELGERDLREAREAADDQQTDHGRLCERMNRRPKDELAWADSPEEVGEAVGGVDPKVLESESTPAE